MPGSKKFRHTFLKNLLRGLRKGAAAAASSRAMSLDERRIAVRRAADAALATARGAAPRWSRSLAAELSQGRLRPRRDDAQPAASSSSGCKPPPASKMMLRRIPRRGRRLIRARPKSKATASDLARVMARKRARALREIVPGGRGMDECTLLGETLDYAVSLKAQIEAMQLLLRTLIQAPK
nr:unnamed protein product [Digitaria exilis]